MALPDMTHLGHSHPHIPPIFVVQVQLPSDAPTSVSATVCVLSLILVVCSDVYVGYSAAYNMSSQWSNLCGIVYFRCFPQLRMDQAGL